MRPTLTRRPAPLLALLLGPLLAQLPGTAQAGQDWLIATPRADIRPGQLLELEVIPPDGAGPWPEQLELKLHRSDGSVSHLPLNAADPGTPQRRRYQARLPAQLQGVLRASLAQQPSNQLALLAAPAPETTPPPREDALQQLSGPAPARPAAPLDPIPEDEPALSAHEPMYFVLGGREGLDARFQLSFKYRLFDRESLPARLLPLLGSMHLGYTQTSLWDLHGESKPFHDTSYRPSLFWQGKLEPAHALLPGYWRGGYEHESNGKDGLSSRSIDTLFIQPVWRRDLADGSSLIFAPKFYNYLEKEDNPDIARYRGHADWILRYGHERGWMLEARLRQGTGGYASGQLDLSAPLREPLFSRTGGFLHFQLFSGYGESLLDYNIRQDPTLRVGFSIVR